MRVLEEQEETAPSTPSSDKPDNVVLGAILLGLRILSERTVQVAANLLPLILVGLGFALWWKVMETPSTFQLIGLAIYGLFALAVLWIRRK